MSRTPGELVALLYQTSLQEFVAERKRLVAELKAAGDNAAAARIGKLARPTISAWAVNQLYFREREAFDELLKTAEQVRAGDLDALAAHRELLARLRAKAGSVLRDAGHSASEATLRRVATTLSALSAAGGFEPDIAGALSADRDPPGFDVGQMALGVATSEGDGAHGPSQERAEPAPDRDASARERERKREEEREREREKRRAERERLDNAVRTRQSDVDACVATVETLRRELSGAEQRLERARQALEEAVKELAAFDASD